MTPEQIQAIAYRVEWVEGNTGSRVFCDQENDIMAYIAADSCGLTKAGVLGLVTHFKWELAWYTHMNMWGVAIAPFEVFHDPDPRTAVEMAAVEYLQDE